MNKSLNSTIVIVENKNAFFNYFILDKLQAGIILKGYEVKSIRKKKCHIKESYIRYIQGEMWIINMHISSYQSKNTHFETFDPTRSRKLLLKKSEILKLKSKIQKKNITLIPLSIYLQNQIIKIKIGLAKGKKLYDKRESIKEKSIQRTIDRSYKEF